MSGVEARELSRDERAAIRALVSGMCANYDTHYGCLPLDGECYMLGKYWSGNYCKYFQNAVLPLDPALEAALIDGGGVNIRNCPICGAAFRPYGKKAYCSSACQREGSRRKSRERMRKKRKKQGV